MRTRTIPLGARHLRTYMEFESYLADFVQGIYPFLWIVGRPGITKTESVKAAMRSHSVYYRKGGQLTPPQFFIDGYHHRGQPIILDDAEHLLEYKIGEKLIAALGDTSLEKLICYGTTSRVLADVPQTYYTTSPLCIIANRATRHLAIQSRAITLYFDPTNLEIHRAVAAWYWDQEIHDWFGQHLYRLSPLDSRWYVIADRDKMAGRDWRQIILKTHALDLASCIVQNLEDDPAYPAREDKARRFLELLGKVKGASRASYFRLRGRLEEGQWLVPEVAPAIPLRRTTRPGTPSLLELESRETARPTPAEEADRPLDVPAREQFVQPIRGDVAPPTAPPRQLLDDTLPWERPTRPDDEGGDE
jgi:hypothetical protein